MPLYSYPDACRAGPPGDAFGISNPSCTKPIPALAASGLGIHFHDLRHTGNALVAEAGANLRELMERMGHSTSHAALIYLHSTNERQHMLADAVAARVQSELRTTAEDA